MGLRPPLTDASVKESKEQVSTALHDMGYSLVDMKVTINLSPSEQKKNDPLYRQRKGTVLPLHSRRTVPRFNYSPLH
ncbi:magnesium chelatase domain-containing protein [Neobacillus sp. NPDC093127]|uniref:magnesium chelatase domain-containing protein n=1 Tax=Neobacillus sp. NPDC093127 TaxID=3364296 RepID=UPI0038082636